MLYIQPRCAENREDQGGSDLKRRGPERTDEETSKTDRIASVFSSSPFVEHTPKMISEDLDMDIKLVTTIVNRLRSEGMIERIGWGRYRLKTDKDFDQEYLREITADMKDKASTIMGGRDRLEIKTSGEDPFNELKEVYEAIRKLGGEVMASNLLRICAKRSNLADMSEMLIEAIGEVDQ
jgi:hypothetical protein